MPAVRVPTPPRVADTATGVDLPASRPGGIALDTAPARDLAAAELLFEEGDLKSYAYRVETGALSLFRLLPDGSIELLDILHPGDWVGLGFLERHGCHARAEVPARVTCYTDDLVAALAKTSPAFSSRIDEAQRFELELSRARALRATRDQPVLRVASFLLVASGNNRCDGRDPTLVADDLKCGTVAGYLGLTLDELGEAMHRLASLGLVAAGPDHELRLLDLPRLEQLVDSA